MRIPRECVSWFRSGPRPFPLSGLQHDQATTCGTGSIGFCPEWQNRAANGEMEGRNGEAKTVILPTLKGPTYIGGTPPNRDTHHMDGARYPIAPMRYVFNF